MASRLSTPSEGEIVESGSEKATKSQPSVHGTSVDRQSRKRASSSPSASPSLSPRPRRRRSHSRSRSPYREYRGSKRPRDDDHYGRNERNDPRSFRVHYEERHYNGVDSSKGSYDRGGHPDHLRYDDRPSSRSREKRVRTASRSPIRHDDRKPGGREGPGRLGRDRSHNGRGKAGLGYAEDRRWHSQTQSVNERRGKNSSTTISAEARAENQVHQTPNSERSRSKNVSFADNVSGDEQIQDMLPEEPVDEATLIEQRRKRREAIKAKHRGQPPPLLVQALSITNNNTPSDSQPTTPAGGTQSADAAGMSPAVASSNSSRQESPAALEVSKDVELTGADNLMGGDVHEDEPSAADYDPTMDMQEDKLRQESRQNDTDLPSAAYDETTNHKQDVLIPRTVVESSNSNGKVEFDMFADDGDDMFAEMPAQQPENGAEDSMRAVPVPAAKALDMSMLDDWDDADGYYRIILGELLDSRYHVQLHLGRGVFSAVVRAVDQVENKAVAIKIIRNNETMRKAALKEIDILKTLNHADPDDKKHLIRLERYFEHKGHLCMVFENLSNNLREILKKFGRDVGINLKAVRAYAQQMFLGLSLLRKCNILHADIKPDNVLVNESRNQLKICDLGSASDVSEAEITPYLVSRFYRAPEIILGMPYDFAIDTWSIGCTLFELYTGKILFTGRTNNQMLRSIMECRGRFSHKILRKAEFANLHFDDMLNFHSVEKDKLTGKDVVRTMNFTKPTRDLRTRLSANARTMADVDGKELNLFIDLLEKCLALNPEKRCTPAEELKHPFILRMKA